MMDHRLLTFITLAKYGNYTRAAEHLNLTQPAVTQHVQYLEGYYGVELVVRNRRGVELTAEGELLLETAQKMNALAIGLKRSLENSTAIVRHYKMGATLTIGEYILPSILGAHKQAYPFVDISMVVQNTDTLLEGIDSGDLDFGLVEGPFSKSKYEHRLLQEDELILVFSPQHRLAGKDEVELQDLLKEKMIVREEGSGTRTFFEEELRRRGYTLSDFDSVMEIGNISAIRTLVLANLGITVISREAVRRELESKALCSIPIHGFDLAREFRFVYRHDSLAKGFIKDFMGFCLEQNSGS